MKSCIFSLRHAFWFVVDALTMDVHRWIDFLFGHQLHSIAGVRTCHGERGGGYLDFKVLKFSGLKELWGSTLWGAWVPGFSLQGVGLENPPPRCKTIQAFQVAWRGYGRGCDFDGGHWRLPNPAGSRQIGEADSSHFFRLYFFSRRVGWFHCW